MEHIDSAGVSTISRYIPRDWLASGPDPTIAARKHAGFAVAADDWSYPH
jgi:hypothetical protein